MRLIHLSDLHIGKRVNEFSMLEDQEYILKEILGIIDDEQPDGVIIAGDVYDKSVPSEEAVKLLDKEAGDRSGKLYGLGHAVYTMSDPRAVLLKKYAQHMAEIKGYADEFALLQKVEELGIPLIQERRKSDAPMCANVDMYSGLVYTMLGIPEDVFTPLFASARIAGWCANRIEEVVTCHRIMRPAYRAVTIRGKYVPMEERTASKAL